MELLTKHYELKKKIEELEIQKREIEKEIIHYMTENSLDKLESEMSNQLHYVATLVIPTRVDKTSCKYDQKWIELYEKEKKIATQRKKVEENYKVTGSPYIRTTIK